jgi:transposase
VPISAPYSLTDCRRFFAKPATARQRQYEALRAFYVDQLPSAEVARRFGYSAGAFRVLCHAFRHGDLQKFFSATRPGRRDHPKKSRAHDQIIALRKRNYSVYEISQALKEQGTSLSATAVREVLAAEGFAPLPRRLDEERPSRIGPQVQAVANVNDFVLTPREFTTRVGGLFLFIPDLVQLESDALAQAAKLPGSRMIPAAHALRASLALKLWAIERKSHIMALVADEGLALFCGLNAMPKKSFLSEYSSRITPQKVAHLLARWHAQVSADLFTGASLNLDFHSVPYFGEHPLVESHYLAKRSRPPTWGSTGSMPPASPSSPCVAAHPHCSPKSPACQRRPGAPSSSTSLIASTAIRASTSRRRVHFSASTASSSLPTSVTMSQPSCSPTTHTRPPNPSLHVTPNVC